MLLAGYVALMVVACRLLAYLAKYVRSPLKVKSLGEWALVTGATDGIGEAHLQSKIKLLEVWMLKSLCNLVCKSCTIVDGSFVDSM